MDDQFDESQKNNLNRWYEARKRIIDELIPNLEKSDSLDAEQKFGIYLTALRYTHDPEILEKATNAAKGIADIASQNDALLNLLQEINYSINLIESSDQEN